MMITKKKKPSYSRTKTQFLYLPKSGVYYARGCVANKTVWRTLQTSTLSIAIARLPNAQECEKALTKACKIVGAPRITHHDLRHLFATQAIEKGVDIPTLSKWLGHSEGRVLAMTTYGHLCDDHSEAMAKLMEF